MTFNCNFCINLGVKSGDHRVRDCPELAKTECRYCHELGHTVSKCPKLSNKSKQPKKRGAFIERRYVPPSRPSRPVQVVDMLPGNKPDSSGFQVVTGRKAPKTVAHVEKSSVAAVSNRFVQPAVQEKEEILTCAAPPALKGAWGAKGGVEIVKENKSEVKPFQELRKPDTLLDEDKVRKATVEKLGLTLWCDDDEEEPDLNDPFLTGDDGFGYKC